MEKSNKQLRRSQQLFITGIPRNSSRYHYSIIVVLGAALQSIKHEDIFLWCWIATGDEVLLRKTSIVAILFAYQFNSQTENKDCLQLCKDATEVP